MLMVWPCVRHLFNLVQSGSAGRLGSFKLHDTSPYTRGGWGVRFFRQNNITRRFLTSTNNLAAELLILKLKNQNGGVFSFWPNLKLAVNIALVLDK